MRMSDWVATILGIQVGLLALLLLLGSGIIEFSKGRLSEERTLTHQLMLTDLAIFNEARYTRHLSQADHHAPFQDFPMSLEHFPSGSLVMPPVAPAQTDR